MSARMSLSDGFAKPGVLFQNCKSQGLRDCGTAMTLSSVTVAQ
jgi:hypothetical protein